MKLSKDSLFAMFVSLVISLALFMIMALEQDKLNARIRTLEMQAGLGDKWAEESK